MFMASKIRAIANDSESKINYDKITDKQWSVYFYLLSISLWNSQMKEDHRFVDKKKVNITAASKLLGITRTTFYKALSQLELYSLIYTLGEEDHYYYLPNPEIYIETSLETITYLLKYRKHVGIDLLRTYILLKKYFNLDGENKKFVKKEIVGLLGHNVKSTEYYHMIEIYLSLLEHWKLIELKKQTITSSVGGYVLYTLIDVKDKSIFTSQEFFNEKQELLAAGMSEEDYSKLKKR